MSNEERDLKLIFDPRTIEHLGIKMYSQLPYALAELVANAYDASAENVSVKLYDSNLNNKKIIVADDGEGMSFEEVRDKFLIIGRKRRDTDESRENSKNRKITGKKGIGKLALFGIGKTIRIETTKKGESQKTIFILNWDSILGEASGIYRPINERVVKDNVDESGTTITLTNLTRITGFDLNATAVSLSKLFNCYDADFKVLVSKNDGDTINLTRELRYAGIKNKEFEWDIETISASLEDGYEHKSELKGKIISTKKPMKQDLRGITLYVNGRLANVPGFFNVPEAGHTFSYVTGWIDADFLDENDKDLISTDRQSLNWDLPEAEDLQNFLQKIVRFLVRDWSAKRGESKNKATATRAGINLNEWFEKVPESIQPKLKRLVEKISIKPELDDEDFSKVIADVHEIFPPYTYFHYRELHGQVQDASRKHYEAKEFYVAFQEAMKRYVHKVEEKSGKTAANELAIVSSAFGNDQTKPLSVTAQFALRPDGQPFRAQTIENIEDGQMTLSRGVVQGGRNVVSHEEHADLKETGLFTEKDCLDLLSLLSHLFKRLDEAVKRQ